jgi:iron donor protein CyaY
MEESTFRQTVEAILKNLLKQLDRLDEGEEMDIKISDGVLQVDFEKGGTFVLSQQVPVRELWLSAFSRAWHFKTSGSGWSERDTGEDLNEVLSSLFSRKLGREIRVV